MFYIEELEDLKNQEILLASKNHCHKFHSLHEGYSVIREEFEELEEELKKARGIFDKDLWQEIKHDGEREDVEEILKQLKLKFIFAFTEFIQAYAMVDKLHSYNEMREEGDD